jgi:hypothetical protein
MSFREVSAWVMGALMCGTGVHYLETYLDASQAHGGAEPPLELFTPYAVFVVVASIVVQIVLASFAPKEADRPPDERERPMLWRAGHWAGLLQGGLCIAAVLYVGYSGDTAILFHLIVGGLIMSQIVEYGLQIAFLRFGS